MLRLAQGWRDWTAILEWYSLRWKVINLCDRIHGIESLYNDVNFVEKRPKHFVSQAIFQSSDDEFAAALFAPLPRFQYGRKTGTD
jgi:hypothetical protein